MLYQVLQVANFSQPVPVAGLSAYLCRTCLCMNFNWGEPEQAPHSRVLKMSFCALLKVGLLLIPHGTGSFCELERRAIG